MDLMILKIFPKLNGSMTKQRSRECCACWKCRHTHVQFCLLLWQPQQTLQLLILTTHLLVPLHGRGQRLRLLSQSVRAGGGSKGNRGVNGDLLGLVSFQTDVAQECAMCWGHQNAKQSAELGIMVFQFKFENLRKCNSYSKVEALRNC